MSALQSRTQPRTDRMADTLMSVLIEQGIVAAEVLADTLSREYTALVQRDVTTLQHIARDKLASTEELAAVRAQLRAWAVKRSGDRANPAPIFSTELAALLARCERQHGVNIALAARLFGR